MLETAIKVGNRLLKNRIVMPPMARHLADKGVITEALLDYYKERSSNGSIAMIITEHSYVAPEGMADPNQVSVSRDEDVAGLKKLSEAVQQNGTLGIVQINHAGSANMVEIEDKAVAPSALVHFRPDIAGRYKERPEVIPHALTLEEIEVIKSQFVNAARRVKEAGFAGVEIHSAHSYLLSEFYSPLMNKRTDKYTGSTIEGRTQLQVEILEAVRQAVGSDFIVSIRLGAVDDMEGGSTVEDVAAAVKRFEAAGADMISITGGANGYMRPGNTQEGWYRDVSRAAKEAVSIPVLVTGGIKTESVAEDILTSEDADLVGVARMLLAKADYVEAWTN